MRNRNGRPRKLFRNPVCRAEEFQKRMQEQGLSRADLARELGVSRARVTQVLNLLKPNMLENQMLELVLKKQHILKNYKKKKILN